MVEACHITEQMCDFLGCGSNGSGDSASERDGTPFQTKSGSSHERGKGYRYLAFLEEHPCAPLANVFSTRQWANSSFKFDHKANVLLRSVLHHRVIQILDLSMRELYEQYCHIEPTYLIFNTPLGNVGDYYYSASESVEKLEQLLLFQYDQDVESVKLFLEDVYDIIDKRVLKNIPMLISRTTFTPQEIQSLVLIANLQRDPRGHTAASNLLIAYHRTGPPYHQLHS